MTSSGTLDTFILFLDLATSKLARRTKNFAWLRSVRRLESLGALSVAVEKSFRISCACFTDGSYIAIVEHARHVFLYDRPDVGAMTAKQRIVDMNSETSPVMGVVATNEYLIILSKDKLYRLQVRT